MLNESLNINLTLRKYNSIILYYSIKFLLSLIVKLQVSMFILSLEIMIGGKSS